MNPLKTDPRALSSTGAGIGVALSPRMESTTTRIDLPPALSASVTVQRVSAYRAAAGETHASRKAVRVTQDYTSSVAGTQPTPNGPAHIEGTGRGTGFYFVGTDGRYLGGSWQQQSSLMISGSFATQPLPITISQKTTVSTLK